MGMHGWKHVNRAIQSADLLFAIGMRFDDRVTGNVRTYAPYARIVHVDIDPAEIGKNVAVEVPIVGDAKRVLAGPRCRWSRRSTRRRAPTTSPSSPSGGATRRALAGTARAPGATACSRPTTSIERIGELTDHEATYVADVGQNQMWLARYAGFRHPNTHVSSGGLGTMGFSVPAAMGAALGRPDRETWAITGDGGFQMTSQELMTLVAGPHPGEDRAPRQQEARDDPPVAGDHLRAATTTRPTCPGPDFAKLADAYGIPAFRARTPAEVDDAIRGRPGGRRPGPRLVRDRRGAERLPDDAGRQGPVRPDREVGRGGRVSGDPSSNGATPPTRPRRRPAHTADRRRPGPCPAAARRGATR